MRSGAHPDPSPDPNPNPSQAAAVVTAAAIVQGWAHRTLSTGTTTTFPIEPAIALGSLLAYQALSYCDGDALVLRCGVGN